MKRGLSSFTIYFFRGFNKGRALPAPHCNKTESRYTHRHSHWNTEAGKREGRDNSTVARERSKGWEETTREPAGGLSHRN